MALPVINSCKPGMVARYWKTDEGRGNTRKVYSNVNSKLKLILLTELSNLVEGKILKAFLSHASLSHVGAGKTNSQERESLKGPES